MKGLRNGLCVLGLVCCFAAGFLLRGWMAPEAEPPVVAEEVGGSEDELPLVVDVRTDNPIDRAVARAHGELSVEQRSGAAFRCVIADRWRAEVDHLIAERVEFTSLSPLRSYEDRRYDLSVPAGEHLHQIAVEEREIALGIAELLLSAGEAVVFETDEDEFLELLMDVAEHGFLEVYPYTLCGSLPEASIYCYNALWFGTVININGEEYLFDWSARIEPPMQMKLTNFDGDNGEELLIARYLFSGTSTAVAQLHVLKLRDGRLYNERSFGYAQVEEMISPHLSVVLVENERIEVFLDNRYVGDAEWYSNPLQRDDLDIYGISLHNVVRFTVDDCGIRLRAIPMVMTDRTGSPTASFVLEAKVVHNPYSYTGFSLEDLQFVTDAQPLS